ncbi:MAG: hypothetical protein HOW97_04555 [Catenulispora sp.]|nr:hypothetical protein [Catenulispora sp.]
MMPAGVDAKTDADNEYEAFYRAYRDRLLRRALQDANGNVHDAEDIVQDAFAALARQWGVVLDPPALLTTIYQRRVFKYWNGRKTQAVPVGLGPAGLAGPVSMVGGDPSATAEQRDIVRQAVTGLSVLERRVVVAEAEGYSRTEIARGLGMSTGHVGSLIRRARKRVRQENVTQAPPVSGRPNASLTAFIPAWTKAVDLLPPRQRQVYRLAAAGCRCVDIARILDISPECARTNLHYAKKTVALHLPQEADSADVTVRDDVADLLEFRVTMCRTCDGRGYGKISERGCDPCRQRGVVPVWFARQQNYFEELGLPAVPDRLPVITSRGRIVSPAPPKEQV